MSDQNLQSMLSRGAITQLFNDGDLNFNPVFQVLTVRMVQKTGDSPVMHRLVLSDGEVWVQGLLAAEMAELVDSPRPNTNGATGDNSKFHRGSLIRVTNLKASKLPNTPRKFLVVHGLEVVSSPSWDKLGTPVQLEDNPALAAPAENQQQNVANLNTGGFYGQPNQPAPTQNNAPAQGNLNQKPLYPPSNTAHQPSAMIAAARAQGGFMPIAELSAFQHKWTVRATCSRKFDIKTWAKPNSTGKLFSVNLMDESGEIRATGFNAECDRLYDTFQEGVVYYISSPGTIKTANKKFSNLKHDYELTFDKDTKVEKADDQSNAPAVHVDYTSIGALANIAKDEVVNVIGVLTDVGDETELVSKITNKPYSKRDLTLVDESSYSIRLTVWGNTAQSFSAPVGSTLSFKGAKVSDFGGKSLSLLSSGSMAVDPDVEAAHRLKGWYESVGKNNRYNSFSNTIGSGEARPKGEILTIKRVKDENFGTSDQPQYFTIKATVVFVNRKTLAYPACGDCNHKVIQTPDNFWRCEKCNKEFPQPTYRYMLTINVSDHTGQMWLSSFDDTGKILMGMSADELVKAQDEDDDGFFKALETAAFKTYFFNCRAKMDVYQDTARVRYQVVSVAPIGYATEGMRLNALIQQYEKVTLNSGAGDNGAGLFVN